MLRLKKLLKDFNITIVKLSKKLNMPDNTLSNKLNCKSDFTIQELENIKSILVDMKIISPDFDIGEFLDIV